nr:putative quinone-oxidoreductase homolog, chloroplastic [Ipomoea batatas]GMD61148.1 putative quinone-oxidoreductase homolog, chloroplastic [Ipomoea batatas]
MAAAGRTMHAVQYDGYGGGAAALKHVEVPVPTPKKGELLVKIEAVSINPVDWKVQEGSLRPMFPRKFPHIPVLYGNFNLAIFFPFFLARVGAVVDIAGEVVEVGSGVQSFKVGDKIVATNNIGDGGGLAEYAVTKETLTAARPLEVSAADAAALPIAGLTAHEALTRVAGVKLDGSGPRKNILVTAASGGVGHYAVQLAKLGNTHVTATCGARKELRRRRGPRLQDPRGGSSSQLIRPEIRHSHPLRLGNSLVYLRAQSQRQRQAENLDYLVKLVKEGKLKTVIDSKHPLSKAEDSWTRSIEGHATGKIIVEP